nr:unnamed protein product [Callosobruchus analis]
MEGNFSRDGYTYHRGEKGRSIQFLHHVEENDKKKG